MSLNCNVLSLPYFGTQFLLDLNMLLAIRALHTNSNFFPFITEIILKNLSKIFLLNLCKVIKFHKQEIKNISIHFKTNE